MAVAVWKQRLIANHNRLIEQLEDKYNDHITKLLQQKKLIIIEMQNALFQQFICIEKEHQQIENEQLMISNSNLNNNIHFSSIETIDNSESKLETETVSNPTLNTNQVPIFSLNDTDPNDSEDSETKSNHCNEKRGRKFECNICHKLLASNHNLRKHMKLHTGEKRGKFECNICHKLLTTKWGLRDHMLIHTGEKPFKCPHCNYRCRTKGKLTVHIRIHTGEKPYECNYCNRRFRLSQSLGNHIRIHTGEKPYECSKCKRKFRTKSNLHRHFKNKHMN